jgi:hypothetical protein
MRRPRQEGSSSIEPEAEAKPAARGSLHKSTREAPSNLAGGRKIRCAIYTHKSSEEGLEQESTPSTRNARPARRSFEVKSMRAGAFCRSSTTIRVGAPDRPHAAGPASDGGER